MFKLDLEVINIVYQQCRALGSIFNFGAFEGFIMYAGLITLGIMKITEKKVKK